MNTAAPVSLTSTRSDCKPVWRGFQVNREASHRGDSIYESLLPVRC
jgi:hypothetical protein